MTIPFYKFRAATFEGSLKDLVAYLVLLAKEADLKNARLLVKYDKDAGVVTRSVTVFLPQNIGYYSQKVAVEPLSLSFWQINEQRKEHLPEQNNFCSYVITDDFEAAEFWLESTMNNFASSKVEFLFEFRTPQNSLVGAALELEKMTIYSSEAADLDSFYSQSGVGTRKTGKLLAIIQNSFLPVTGCNDDRLSKMLREYPRAESTEQNNMKNLILPNIRNKFGFISLLNLTPSFNQSPISVWEGDGAQVFCKNYLQAIIRNNKVNYIGVNSTNVTIPTFDMPYITIRFKSRFDPVAYLFALKEAYPDTDLSDPFGVGGYCLTMTKQIILTEVEKEYSTDEGGLTHRLSMVKHLIESVWEQFSPFENITDFVLQLIESAGEIEHTSNHEILAVLNRFSNFGQCDYGPYIDALNTNYIVIDDADLNLTESNKLAMMMTLTRAELTRRLYLSRTTFKLHIPLHILNLDMSNSQEDRIFTSMFRSFRKQGIASFFFVNQLNLEPSDWTKDQLSIFAGTNIIATEKVNEFDVKGCGESFTVNAEVF